MTKIEEVYFCKKKTLDLANNTCKQLTSKRMRPKENESTFLSNISSLYTSGAIYKPAMKNQLSYYQMQGY